jgi:hypothetical protein
VLINQIMEGQNGTTPLLRSCASLRFQRKNVEAPRQTVSRSLRDIIGKRGENIVELCFTDYANFSSPLFSPTHLGDKWPVVDYYVEIENVKGKRPFFFVQAKATASTSPGASLRISSTRDNVAGLLQIPAPTYILGVHEPSKRVLIQRYSYEQYEISRGNCREKGRTARRTFSAGSWCDLRVRSEIRYRPRFHCGLPERERRDEFQCG